MTGYAAAYFRWHAEMAARVPRGSFSECCGWSNPACRSMFVMRNGRDPAPVEYPADVPVGDLLL